MTRSPIWPQFHSSGDGVSGVIWNSDLISIREGRALVFLSFGSPVIPMPDAEVQRLTDAVLGGSPPTSEG